jgi:hypothetical protein
MSGNHSFLDQPDLEWIARACGKAGRLGVNKWICLCPAHDDRTPSLSISLGRKGQILFYCHAGCSYDNVINNIGSDIQNFLKIKQRKSEYRDPINTIYKEDNLKLSFYNSDTLLKDNRDKSDNNGKIPNDFTLKNLLKDAKPVINTPVEAYLNKRLNGSFPDITDILAFEVIRHLPGHWHTESRKSWPVMLASILYGDQLIGLHRTYLDGNGNKAPVSPPKKILGKLTGGYTPFGTPKNILILAEGIETALSLYAMFQTPVWATLSATNMANITLPPLPVAQTVYIAQDNDEAGKAAAQKAADKFWREGRRVILMILPDPLSDFNDYLTTGEPYEQYRHHFYGIPATSASAGSFKRLK